MTDRYQPLRDAIAGPIIRSPRIAVRAAGSICVGDTRPVDTVEDLERGLHIEILGGENTEAEAQFIAAADPDTITALLKERDALRVLLRRAGDELCCCGDLMAEADDEAVDENDWRDSHFCPHCDDSVDRTWEVRHAIRAALADGEEA